MKLLQAKKDRDWVFLYLISFFEVLLAAGLSFSPVFLGTLTLYLLCGLSTIIAFEIQKAKRAIAVSETHLLVPPDSRIFKKARAGARQAKCRSQSAAVCRAWSAAADFCAGPAVVSGGATLGRRGPYSGRRALTNFIGFSESVTLGEIGDLKRDNAVVMHVRIEDAQPRGDFRWRGVALDEFTGRGWRESASRATPNYQLESDKGFFQLGTTAALHRLTTQTVFLEPIESPVLFAAPRPVAIQGDFPLVRVDGEGSIQTRRHEFERVIYKVLSDMSEPTSPCCGRRASLSGGVRTLLEQLPPRSTHGLTRAQTPSW